MPLFKKLYDAFNGLTNFHILLVLCLLGFAAYIQTVYYPFVHDDVAHIVDNPAISRLDLTDIFIKPRRRAVESDLINRYYRPLIDVAQRLEYKLFKFDPKGYHYVNILLHVLNAYLCFLILNAILKRKGIAFASALLFLLHPVQTEAVACISGISNLLFTVFCLGAFHFYLAWYRFRKKEHYALSVLFFLFGLLTKEQSIVLVPIVLLYNLLFDEQKRSFIKKIVPSFGFIFATGFYLLIRRIIFGFTFSPSLGNPGELKLRLLSIPQTLLDYFKIIFYPVNLHYYRVVDILDPYVWPSITLFLVFLFTAIYVFREPKEKRNLNLFFIGFFILSLLPTLNIIPLVNEYSLILAFEHFLYLPVIGLFAFVCFALHNTFSRFKCHVVSLPLIVCVSILCLILTNKQNQYWRSEIPLFKRSLQAGKDMARTRMLLAKAYYFQKQFELSVKENFKALEMLKFYRENVSGVETKRFYQLLEKEAFTNLGYNYMSLNELDKSLDYFHRAMAIDPQDTALYNNLASIYVGQNKFEDAIKFLEEARKMNNRDILILSNLAYCYTQLGKYEAAKKVLRKIIEINPQANQAKAQLKSLENLQ